MKKTAVLMGLSALCCCIGIGLLTLGGFSFGAAAPTRNTMRTAAATVLTSRGTTAVRAVSRPKLDVEDDGPLLEQGQAVLTALAEEDFSALSHMVHPARGVTCTPYSTVDPEHDLCFLPDQIARAEKDESVYLWGFRAGNGGEIGLTIPDYFRQYVYDADYLHAPEQSVDEVRSSGNALENVGEVFAGDRFIEYYFPGIDPGRGQFDWCALKLVFAPYGERWYLVGLIHSEWVA